MSGILIQGALALNRATDGDVVAIRLLPREHWRSESNLLLASDDAAAERDANALATLDAKSTAAGLRVFSLETTQKIFDDFVDFFLFFSWWNWSE